MSAFVVGHAHIDALVTFCLDHKVSYWLPKTHSRVAVTLDNAEEIGRILLEENETSVGHRYPGDHPEELPGAAGETAAGYRFRRYTPAIPAGLNVPLVILKACHCLEYQSCEHDGWPQSTAWIIVQAIKDTAQRALPGYDKAPGWELRRPR